MALVSPATLEFLLPIVFVVMMYAVYARQGWAALVPSCGSGCLITCAVLTYAAASAGWAQRPLAAFGWVAGATAVALASGMASRAMLQEPRRNILHIGEGLWVGILVGLAYIGIESLTGQAIKIPVYNLLHLRPEHLKPLSHFVWSGSKIVSISPFDLTRSVAPVPLFLWPALLAIRGTLVGPLARKWGIGTFLFGAAAVAVSPNETAKMALAVGAAGFLFACLSRTWSLRVLQVAWAVACLLIVPISLGLYRANLHNAPWVQPTAQHRIIIWNRTAEETMKAPYFGIGAGMAYWNFDASKKLNEGESYRRYSRDAHSVFLQTWFELGIVGATLLCLFGLAVLQRIQRLGPVIAPYAHATFASSVIMLASSWGMWRPWFMYMFAYAVVLFAIGVRTTIRQQVTPGLETALR
ncbi:MAG: O-antigen ligase family protein [Hyphomicrobium sp.]